MTTRQRHGSSRSRSSSDHDSIYFPISYESLQLRLAQPWQSDQQKQKNTKAREERRNVRLLIFRSFWNLLPRKASCAPAR